MTDTNHITPDTAAAWQGKQVPPEQIASVAGHLSQCEACRVLVSVHGAESRLIASLAGGDEHLDYEDLIAFHEGKASEDDRTLYAFHLSRCAVCASELADLQRLIAAKSAPPRRRWFLLPVGGLVLASALLLWLIPPRHQPEKAPAAVPPAPAVIASVTDSGRAISVDSGGVLHGLEGASPELAALADSALRNGEIPPPSGNVPPLGSRELLLGKTVATETIHSFEPAGSVVPPGAQHFRWVAPPDAARFVVAIYTADFNPVMTSPELSSPEWTSPRALKPGSTYVWTVSAMQGGKRVTAPRSPEPEARFRVATASEAEEWNASLNMKPPSDLAQALTASRLGMYAEAEAALQRLEAANAASPANAALISRLRENLSASHQAHNSANK